MEDASRSNGNNWQNSWNDLQQTIGGWVDKGVSHLPESAQNVVRGREKLIAMGAAVCTALGLFASCQAMESDVEDTVLDAHIIDENTGSVYVRLCDGPNLVTAELTPNKEDIGHGEYDKSYLDHPDCAEFGEQTDSSSLYDGFTDYSHIREEIDAGQIYRAICLPSDALPSDARPPREEYYIYYSPNELPGGGHNDSVGVLSSDSVCDTYENANLVK